MTEPQSIWLDRLANLLIRFRVAILISSALLTLLAWPIANQLRFDQSIESLYAKNDRHLKNYVDSKKWFGGDEFAIVAYSDRNLFKPDGNELTEASVDNLGQLARQLNSIPGIRQDSTQELGQALKFPYARERVKKLVEGVLLGSDNETTAIVVRLLSEQDSPKSRAETIAHIRQVASDHSPPASVVGEPVMVHDMFRYVEEDGSKLFKWSLGLLSLVILFLFRNLRWVVLPILVVVTTIYWTEAILVLTQTRLSMVSSMLNSLVTIIAIATVTHVTVHFRELRRTLDRESSLRQTFVELAPAIFWTCATTAIGFGALLSSHITPVQSFGRMMALGTLLVLCASATILPGGILIGRKGTDPNDAPAEEYLVRLLDRITDWGEHRPRLLMLGAMLVVGFSVVGFFRLNVETDFSKNFREDSPIVASLDLVETHLGGAGTWEVTFAAPQELSAEYLEQVAVLTRHFRQLLVGEGQLTKVIALTDGLELVPRLPFILDTLRKRLNALQGFQPEFESSLYNAKFGRMRILLRSRERGQQSASKLRLISESEKLARKQFPDAQASGLFVLLTFLIDSLLRDQLTSFALATCGIGLMMTIAFRSFWIGLVSLVPNLFPIVLVIGSMGWIGLPINIATAMIASVSMGLTVDFSIHYISGYRRARSQGMSVNDALRTTHSGVGRALVFANLALIVGFSVLTLSHFIPLVYFGILVSVAMFGGLVGNLILLPLLLRWVEKSS